MKRKFVSVLTSIALVAVLAPPAFSTTSVPSFETELTQADFVGFRHFGAAVAIDGDTAIVGVPQDPQAGFDSGSVYIYVRDGSQWSQQAKLIAADPAPSSKFGSAVAISGDTVVVGAPFRMNGSLKTGAAYVFVRSGSAWTQQTKLTPTDGIGDDAFGSAVTVEADTLAVGAFGTGLAGIGFPGEGAVYVFTRNATAWSQRARLRSDVPGTGNWFGFSLALDHGTLAVGSPTDDDLLLADAGAVYVYTGSGSTWNLQDELTASDAAAGDRLGWSVALSGDTLLVGAPQNHSGASFAGAAYAFVRAGADWSQEKKLVAADSAMLDCFGYSVALVNNTAIVGSVLDSSFAPSGGSAYVFTRSGGAWSQNSEFSAGDIERDFRFGYSVALSGTTIFVGAPFGTFFQEGAAYLYELTSSNTAPTADAQSVVTDEDTAAVVTLTGTDPEGDSLTFTVLSGPIQGTLSGTPPNLTYTPFANANGPDTFTFKINDGSLDSPPATVSINIAPVNDAPAADDQSVTTTEDTPATITLTGSDVEGSALTFTVLAGPARGTLSGTPPNLIYTPFLNANGPDNFTFKVNDGDLDSPPATVTINVAPANDDPTISGISDRTIPVNSTTGLIAFTVEDVDNDPVSLVISANSDNPTLAPVPDIVLGGSGADRTITITPAANQSGTATITLTVSDGLAVSQTAFLLTVSDADANHSPTADASATVPSIISSNTANAVVTLDGSRSSDPDNDPLTFTWLENGNAIASGSVTQIALAVGTHTITLVVSDGAASDSATVTVRVVTLADTITEIIAAVQTTDIPSTQKTELNAILRAAAGSCARGNLISGANQLQAFENKVAAQAGKKIDETTANSLIADAQNVIQAITGAATQASRTARDH